jgi:hypothetical protein
MFSDRSVPRARIFLSNLLIVMSLLLASCDSLHPQPTPAPTCSQSVTEEEYVVYRALIEARYIQNNTQLIVIQDHTDVEIPDLNEGIENLIQNLPGLTTEMITKFKLKNQRSWALKPLFNLTTATFLFGEDEFQQIFMEQDGWERFYNQFPSSQGIMTLSRVGFNAKMNKALVYVGNQSHGLAGGGFYLLLVKENGSWKVEAEDMVWIS